MMKRREFLRTAGLTAALGLGPVAVRANDTKLAKGAPFKLGWVRPTTGRLASSFAQLYIGGLIAVEEINTEGGIKALGGARIKLVFGDSKSTPDGGMAETERLITAAKNDGVAARRKVAQWIPDRTTVKKVFEKIAPRFVDRPGGYTRILRLGARAGERAARGVALELERLAKPHVLKIYPPIGHTPDDGHNFVYTDIDRWEPDVFGFLDRYVRR